MKMIRSWKELVWMGCLGFVSLAAQGRDLRFAALQKEIFGAPKENIETLPEIAELPDAGSTEKSFFSLNWQIAAVVFGLLLVVILSFIWFYRR